MSEIADILNAIVHHFMFLLKMNMGVFQNKKEAFPSESNHLCSFYGTLEKIIFECFQVYCSVKYGALYSEEQKYTSS